MQSLDKFPVQHLGLLARLLDHAKAHIGDTGVDSENNHGLGLEAPKQGRVQDPALQLR